MTGGSSDYTSVLASSELYHNFNTVTFNSNGGSAVASQSIAYNSTALEPAAPTKTGFAFAGWYSDVALTSAFSFGTAITGTITLNAKWTTLFTLTVSLSGTGNGSVHGSPMAGISCSKESINGNGCSGNFSADVTLTAVPESTTSVFSGWTNVCEATPMEKDCNITLAFMASMTPDKPAIATFTLSPRCKINLTASTGYDTLQTAYSNAVTAIFALDGLFTGGWTLDQGKNITLKGGYLADYGSTRNGFTILGGKLTIKNGSLRVDRLKIRP